MVACQGDPPFNPCQTPPCLQVLPWFKDRLGYAYAPAQHGAVSDWLIDLVSTSTNRDAGSSCVHHMSLKVRCLLHTSSMVPGHGAARAAALPAQCGLAPHLHGVLRHITACPSWPACWLPQEIAAAADAFRQSQADGMTLCGKQETDALEVAATCSPAGEDVVHSHGKRCSAHTWRMPLQCLGRGSVMQQPNKLLHAVSPQRRRLCRSARTPFCNQARVLLKRSLVSYSRNPANAAGRVAMATMLGIFAGIVFLNVGTGAERPLSVCTACCWCWPATVAQQCELEEVASWGVPAYSGPKPALVCVPRRWLHERWQTAPPHEVQPSEASSHARRPRDRPAAAVLAVLHRVCAGAAALRLHDRLHGRPPVLLGGPGRWGF